MLLLYREHSRENKKHLQIASMPPMNCISHQTIQSKHMQHIFGRGRVEVGGGGIHNDRNTLEIIRNVLILSCFYSPRHSGFDVGNNNNLCTNHIKQVAVEK